MRDDYKKERVLRPVHFNPRNPVHLQILRFIDRKEVNYSELVRNLLFTYIMTNPETNRLASIPTPQVKRTRKRKSKPTMIQPPAHQVEELDEKITPRPEPSTLFANNQTINKEKRDRDDFGGLPIDF